MSNIITRSLSGIVFVALTVGSIMLGMYTFLGYFFIIMLLSTNEFYRLCQIRGDKPHVVLGLVISAYIFVSVYLSVFDFASRLIYVLLIPLLMLIPIVEVMKAKSRRILNVSFTLLAVIYVAVPFSMLSLIACCDGKYCWQPLLLLFVILWANDTGAYLVGSTIGKHKLAPKISPNKTWEGSIGGGVFAILIAWLMSLWIGFFSQPQALIVGVLVAVFGTLGDLSESMFKRSFNVKDSGKIIPGHGGLLDRFDSLLFSAPVYYLYLILI